MGRGRTTKVSTKNVQARLLQRLGSGSGTSGLLAVLDLRVKACYAPRVMLALSGGDAMTGRCRRPPTRRWERKLK